MSMYIIGSCDSEKSQEWEFLNIYLISRPPLFAFSQSD